jgi:hypothetical protein
VKKKEVMGIVFAVMIASALLLPILGVFGNDTKINKNSATTSPSAEPEVRGGAGRVAYNQVENNYEVFSPPSEPISFGIPLARHPSK